MIKSDKIKKIVAVAIAAALMSSYSITAFAGEVSLSDLPDDSVVEKIKIDWSSLDEATSHMLEKLTEEEKTAIADIVEDVRPYKEKLEALDETDKATALNYTAIYNAISDIVSEKYANDAIIKNTFIAAQNIFESTIDNLDNVTDYETFDTLIDKLKTMDLKKNMESALAGTLTEDEFVKILDLSKTFKDFSDTFQSVFAEEYAMTTGLLNTSVENNAKVQAIIELFEIRYAEILEKSTEELSLEDETSVKAAITEYEKLSAMSKFALNEHYMTLLDQNSAIEILKESIKDNESTNVSDSDMPSVSDSDMPSVSDSDMPSVSDSDIPAVSDSDVEKPSNPSSGNGTVSDSDTIVSDTDANKGNDSVTDIDTGEAGYMIPSLFTMASSALSYLGVAFKKKKSEELM